MNWRANLQRQTRRRPPLLALPPLAVIQAYRRLVSPFIQPRCRYYPSCSAYAAQSLHTHGLVRGSALAAWRVVRCNPWSDGGLDPVPQPRGEARIPGRSIGPDL